MRRMLLAVLVVAVGCGDDALPWCVDLGCPFRPSGSPEIWTPCEDDVCFCRDSRLADTPSVACAPAVEEQSSCE